YSRQMLFTNQDNFNLVGVSGDGQWLVLQKVLSNKADDLYLVDLKSNAKTPKKITRQIKESVSHVFFSFTADNKQLIYGTDAYGEFRQAWSYDLASGRSAPLYQPQWDVLYVNHSKKGRYRVIG